MNLINGGIYNFKPVSKKYDLEKCDPFYIVVIEQVDECITLLSLDQFMDHQIVNNQNEVNELLHLNYDNVELKPIWKCSTSYINNFDGFLGCIEPEMFDKIKELK